MATCKKQTAVSHSSTEAEFSSLENFLREQALPMLSLWALVFDLFGGSATSRSSPDNDQPSKQGREKSQQILPEETPKSLRSVRLLVLEDNEAVINILQKRHNTRISSCYQNTPDQHRLGV